MVAEKEKDIASQIRSGQPAHEGSSRSDGEPDEQQSEEKHDSGEGNDDDLKELLLELRIPLQGTQLLTAFLITLPFSQGFSKLQAPERWVYLATFVCSITSLILFSAPAVHHRLERPLRDPERFKTSATRLVIAATAPLSVALILATQLVVNEVGGLLLGLLAAGMVAVLIGVIWWAVPLIHKNQHRQLAR